ncbi:MAG TPA: ribonuclease HII [Anaerolineales bacterium]|nr:ribonuclease HII [Anaerolineales bacterium]
MSARFDPSLLPPAPDLSFEQALWAAGLRGVAGIDEAGRGPLAGPVAAAVVVFPPDAGLTVGLAGVRDSKQMTPYQRQAACPRIQAAALGFAVGFAEAAEIDTLGILPATRLAAWRALQALPFTPDHLLLDALFLPDVDLPQTALIKGDRRSLSIAAASVLAKTARDARLEALEQEYPGYGFARHKGYGTAAHRAALQQLGPCPQHRRSFHLKNLTGITRL